MHCCIVQLEEFKSKSLIEHYNPYSGEILVHDLYREFIQMEVEKEGFQHNRKCVYSEHLIKAINKTTGFAFINKVLNIEEGDVMYMLGCRVGHYRRVLIFET